MSNQILQVDECLWSNKAVRCRHLFWTVMAFIVDGVGGMALMRMSAPVPLVFLIDSRVPVNHSFGFSGGKE